MSVLSPIVDLWDGENRRVYLKQGVSNYYPIEDIYHEYRNARRLDENFRKFEPLLLASGNVPKGGGAYTPRYVVLLNGTKIVPYDETLQLNQLGDMITDNPDVDATLYDISGLTVPKPIFIKPSEAETIQLNNESIVYSTFQNAVWYHKDSIYSDAGSATRPNGNAERPVNSIALAVSIAHTRGFNRLQLRSNAVLTAGDDVSNMVLIGDSHVNSLLDIEDSAVCLRTQIFNCNVSGILDGETNIQSCVVRDLTYVNGHIHDSGLRGTIVLDGASDAVFANCYTMDFNALPVVDMNGSGQNLAMPNYAGSITIRNLASDQKIGIGLVSGKVTLTETVTAGIITVSGTGLLDDYSTATVVIKDGLMTRELIAESSWSDIYLDTVYGFAGTDFPIGTASKPVNNVADAKTIASRIGSNSFSCRGEITLDDNCEGCVVKSDAPQHFIVNTNGYSLDSASFHSVTLRGACDGVIDAKDCVFDQGMTNLEGHLDNCILKGLFSVKAGSNLDADRCTSSSGAIFDLNGTGSAGFASVSGILQFRDMSSLTSQIGVTGTYLLTLEPSITAGTVLIAGIGILNDYSGGATIIERTLPSAVWTAIAESGLTTKELLTVIAAAVAGKTSGASTTEITFRDLGDTKDRIVGTVDANGNRTAVTVDGS